MACRMQCTSCLEIAEPETLLGGSDLAEIASWLCFVVPGWLYCLWRHSLRRKICQFCGSESLIREARAAQARTPVSVPREDARVRSSLNPRHWPRALSTPRKRLMHGGVGALFLSGLLLCLALSALPNPPLGAEVSAFYLSLICLGWMLLETLRVRLYRAPACSAWDESGRAIQIEWLG
jgi:hypothetical protein